MRFGQELSPSQVPATFLSAFVDDDLVGRVSIRHALSEQLMRVGGHIGYAVRPQFRRHGFAIAILRHSLDLAGEMGIELALVTCHDSNVGSIATIERCGGVLDHSEQTLVHHKLRYWNPTTIPGSARDRRLPETITERSNPWRPARRSPVTRPADLRTENTGTAICVAHHLHHERLDRKPLRGAWLAQQTLFTQKKR
ncbi:MAG: GNAT family N-acetyltransferase [Candidatus Saccharibacteria bacterium]|nr:GNAT family N-acetyltransferase [Microbacteriaceae bacterium]